MLCSYQRLMQTWRTRPMFEDSTDRDKQQLREVRELDRLLQRQDNRVISCLACGTALAIYVESGRVPTTTCRCEQTNAPADEAEALEPR